jgi:hypothetical protein
VQAYGFELFGGLLLMLNPVIYEREMWHKEGDLKLSTSVPWGFGI